MPAAWAFQLDPCVGSEPIWLTIKCAFGISRVCLLVQKRRAGVRGTNLRNLINYVVRNSSMATQMAECATRHRLLLIKLVRTYCSRLTLF